jgi:hypothetical protein
MPNDILPNDTILELEDAVAKAPARGDAGATRYVRRNLGMSRAVYRAQLIHRTCGPGAARAFMRVMKVDAAVAERVIHSSRHWLRR